MEEILFQDNEAFLIREAVDARTRAYAPYSHYPVGAALLAVAGEGEDEHTGGLFSGCNVENASYGLTICAERTAVFSAVAAGARKILAIAIATGDGGSPCGACRQVLAEFRPRGAEMRVILVNGEGIVVRRLTLTELLPLAFDLGEEPGKK